MGRAGPINDNAVNEVKQLLAIILISDGPHSYELLGARFRNSVLLYGET
jgi:hypothetical protein